MKKFILFLLTSYLAVICNASDIQVKISDGVDSDRLKIKMEITTARILNEVNDAQAQNRGLNFQAMSVNESVSRSMSLLWENTPFVCTEELIIERCITTKSGYQVRNIPLLIKPRGDHEFNEDENMEAVISFDKNGNVESFYLTISQSLYINVIKDYEEVTDLRCRQIMLDFVEQLYTAYYQHDITFLNQVFSDETVTIIGKEQMNEYIARLRKIISSLSFIKVKFDEIEIMHHPFKKDYYCVTLHQGYSTSAYHDDGYLFLLWDFTNEDTPQILARAWQPGRTNGKTLPKDEVFKLWDFEI